MMNNDEQIKECEISFYTFIFEDEDKELKKNDVKGKDNVGFVIPFCRETISVLNLVIGCFLTVFQSSFVFSLH